MFVCFQVKKPYLELLERNHHDRFPAVEVIPSFHIFVTGPMKRALNAGVIKSEYIVL